MGMRRRFMIDPRLLGAVLDASMQAPPEDEPPQKMMLEIRAPVEWGDLNDALRTVDKKTEEARDNDRRSRTGRAKHDWRQ